MRKGRNMKKLVMAFMCTLALPASARSVVLSPQVKTLQVVVNQDWLSPPVMRLGTDDVLNVGFDELSHTYHRYIYRLEHCEADWSTSKDIFESDWLNGFNNNPIEDYRNSINTTVLYTHYQLSIPTDRGQLKMSGNYRLHIIDDDTQEEQAVVEFQIAEQSMAISVEVSTNTDIDHNTSHQQLIMRVNYGQLSVTNPQEQIKTVVKQNDRDDNCRRDVRPTMTYATGLEWTHCRQLIFDGGNEYRKYEVLDPSHPTMGIDYIRWDGSQYQVFPFMSEPRPNYIYDEDANGAFYIRNSDNRENDIATEYVWVNYRLKAPALYGQTITIDGRWTTEAPDTYHMTYDESECLYTARILQKQGYYSYQYLWQDMEDRRMFLPSEGSFYQTENCYQVYIYYKGTGERTWRLVGYRFLRYSSGN